MKKEVQKQVKSLTLKRPATRRKQVDGGFKEEKNLSLFCKPSKIVSINEFLRTHISKDKLAVRENHIRMAGFGFLLDLAIDDPTKNDMMTLVRKRWDGDDVLVTEDHVQEIYGAARFGKMRIDMDAPWSDRAKLEFKEQLAGMSIQPSDHLYLKIKDLESALKRLDKDVLSDDGWAKIYILYALSVFLLAPTTYVIWGKYWQYLVPLTLVRNYDWIGHITSRTNAEFVRACDALIGFTHIKMGGNAHALLDYFKNVSRRAKTRNVPSSAAKLLLKRPKTSDPYHKMSLSQLYESFFKLHLEREAVDKEIDLVKVLIAEKEKTVKVKVEENREDVGDKDKEDGKNEDYVNELEREVVQDRPAHDLRPEVEEGKHDDVLQSEIDDATEPHVQLETKRKAPLSDVDEEVEALNKKGRTMAGEEEMCTLWERATV